jgi:hypothetical protein
MLKPRSIYLGLAIALFVLMSAIVFCGPTSPQATHEAPALAHVDATLLSADRTSEVIGVAGFSRSGDVTQEGTKRVYGEPRELGGSVRLWDVALIVVALALVCAMAVLYLLVVRTPAEPDWMAYQRMFRRWPGKTTEGLTPAHDGFRVPRTSLAT